MLTKAPDLGSQEAYLGAQLPPYLGRFQPKHAEETQPHTAPHSRSTPSAAGLAPEKCPVWRSHPPNPSGKESPGCLQPVRGHDAGGCGGWDNPIRNTVELHSLLLNAGCCLDS